MSDRKLIYITLGISATTLIIVAVLAQHLNSAADQADKATQGLLGNAKVQSLLTGIGNLFGGGK